MNKLTPAISAAMEEVRACGGLEDLRNIRDKIQGIVNAERKGNKTQALLLSNFLDYTVFLHRGSWHRSQHDKMREWE